jgi:hypothetical protein
VDEGREAVVEHAEQVTYVRAKQRTPGSTPAKVFAHFPVTQTAGILLEMLKLDPSLYERNGEKRTFELDLYPCPPVRETRDRPAKIRPLWNMIRMVNLRGLGVIGMTSKSQSKRDRIVILGNHCGK